MKSHFGLSGQRLPRKCNSVVRKLIKAQENRSVRDKRESCKFLKEKERERKEEKKRRGKRGSQPLGRSFSEQAERNREKKGEFERNGEETARRKERGEFK